MTQRTKTPFRQFRQFRQVLTATPDADFRPFCQLCQPVNAATHLFAAAVLAGSRAGLTPEQIRAAILSAAEVQS